MSYFDKLFGRTYSTVGNSDSDFIIKTRGQVKVQWGKKFIDIIKDGKLNVDVSFIGSVDSYNDIGSKDGLYYVKEDGSIYLVVNGNIHLSNSAALIGLSINDNSSLATINFSS